MMSLDSPERPQMFRAIETPRGKRRHKICQLAIGTWHENRDMMEVRIQVEVRVFDPIGDGRDPSAHTSTYGGHTAGLVAAAHE